MVTKLKPQITILDAGARYGLHPTWKNLNVPCSFILVEPDPDEFQRLALRYKDRPNIEIHQIALGDHNGNVDLMIRHNPAMSGTINRNSISPLYQDARFGQDNVMRRLNVELQTLDSLQESRGHYFDFLKLDTEGNEYSILEGCTDLSRVIGVRSEVSFDHLFDETPQQVDREGSFSRIHCRLRSEGFVLLNLDYLGRGDYFSPMILSDERCGVLQSTDAVWVKDPKVLAGTVDAFTIFKAAIFLLRNHAPDVAFWLLENTSASLSGLSWQFEPFLNCTKIEVVKHLYRLKWSPGQDIRNHAMWYEKIFDDQYPVMNKFNESLDFNPLDAY